MGELKIMEKVFFVGINGIGMSGLAKIMKKRGYDVYGSDISEKEITKELRNIGIKVFIKQVDINIQGMDMVVYSSAIKKSNTEYVYAKLNKIPLIKRGELLAKLMNNNRAIAIAGTHGKTTTTSMLGLAMLEKDPTIVVGGIVPELESNARVGNSSLFIAEADESDNSFLYIKPDYAIVTNIEPDHLENHGNFENLKKSFLNFIKSAREQSILCIDCPELKKIAKEYGSITYSVYDKTADIYAEDIRQDGNYNVYNVIINGDSLGEFRLSIPGIHNISNSLGVIYLAYKEGAEIENIKKALQNFKGAKRRFDILYNEEIMIVDDYAHHPTEISATLKAARERKKNRLIAVFQPHRYSRTNFLLEQFKDAFKDADEVMLLPIYSAGEKNIYGITEEMLAEKIAQTKKIKLIKDKSQLIEKVLKEHENGDIYVFMGAGDVYQVAYDIKKSLEG